MKYVFALSLVAFVVFMLNTEVRSEDDTTLTAQQQEWLQQALDQLKKGYFGGSAITDPGTGDSDNTGPGTGDSDNTGPGTDDSDNTDPSTDTRR
ncbi:hypothetical protein U1Q18_051679 [Sarracenia purpurea var. burkii]